MTLQGRRNPSGSRSSSHLCALAAGVSREMVRFQSPPLARTATPGLYSAVMASDGRARRCREASFPRRRPGGWRRAECSAARLQGRLYVQHRTTWYPAVGPLLDQRLRRYHRGSRTAAGGRLPWPHPAPRDPVLRGPQCHADRPASAPGSRA